MLYSFERQVSYKEAAENRNPKASDPTVFKVSK